MLQCNFSINKILKGKLLFQSCFVITWSTVINIAPLTVLVCNCPLADL